MSGPDAGRQALVKLAFHRAAAADASAEISRQREACASPDGALGTSYEIVVPEADSTRFLVEKVLPKLVYFLDCRGAKLPDAPGVFTSVFAGDALYFVHARDVISALAELSGLSPREMVARWGAASV